MKSVWDIAKELDLSAAPMWGDTYQYDPQKNYDQRGSESVWTWWPKGESSSGIHFTIWESDSDERTALLKSFHITFNYNNESHKPVHVYYRIRGAKPSFWKVDTNRAGNDAQAAERYTEDHAGQFDELAWKFVKAAVWS